MPGTCPGTFCSDGLHLGGQLVIPVGKDSRKKAVRFTRFTAATPVDNELSWRHTSLTSVI